MATFSSTSGSTATTGHMPFHMETTAATNAPQLLNTSGGPLEKSLFVPVYQQDLNSDEREVAVYLDGEKALTWWHRNASRSQYGIQGWQDRKIYPRLRLRRSTRRQARAHHRTGDQGRFPRRQRRRHGL